MEDNPASVGPGPKYGGVPYWDRPLNLSHIGGHQPFRYSTSLVGPQTNQSARLARIRLAAGEVQRSTHQAPDDILPAFY